MLVVAPARSTPVPKYGEARIDNSTHAFYIAKELLLTASGVEYKHYDGKEIRIAKAPRVENADGLEVAAFSNFGSELVHVPFEHLLSWQINGPGAPFHLDAATLKALSKRDNDLFIRYAYKVFGVGLPYMTAFRAFCGTRSIPFLAAVLDAAEDIFPSPEPFFVTSVGTTKT